MKRFRQTIDRNGNSILRVIIPGARSFSIQTNGNLPETHRDGICPATAGEIREYVRQFGTARQRGLIGYTTKEDAE